MQTKHKSEIQELFKSLAENPFSLLTGIEKKETIDYFINNLIDIIKSLSKDKFNSLDLEEILIIVMDLQPTIELKNYFLHSNEIIYKNFENNYDTYKNLENFSIFMYNYNNAILTIQSLNEKTIYEIAEQALKLQDSYKELEKKHKKAVENLGDVNDRVNAIIPNALTIIGIFTAVMFVFFGGISLIDAFSTLSQESTHRFLIVCLLTGQIIFDSLFILLYLVSHISDKQVSVVCTHFQPLEILLEYDENGNVLNERNILRICYNCKFSIEEPKCRAIQKIIYKYPYIFYSNTILFILEAVVVLWWFCEKYLFRDYVLIFPSPFLGTAILLFEIVIILFCILFLIFTTGKPHTESKTTKNKIHWRRHKITVIVVLILSVFVSIALFLKFGIEIIPKIE